MKKSLPELYCPYSKNCYECCLDTEMILLESEVKKIESLGYDSKHFLRKVDGFLQLQNIDGHCYFLKKKKCTIYKFRPKGCRFYPLIYDFELEEYVIDDLCYHNKDFDADEFQHIHKNLYDLVNKLLKEKSKRERQKNI